MREFVRAGRRVSSTRAETGGVLALGYAAQRGYGQAHPTVNELRLAEAKIEVRHPDGRAFSAGRVKVSQAEVVDKKGEKLNIGYAATFGWNEVKCIAAATLDLNRPGAEKGSPTEEEFFLYHTEGVESSGFCIHFKLPHYVTFQASLDALRDAKARPRRVAGTQAGGWLGGEARVSQRQPGPGLAASPEQPPGVPGCLT